MSRSDILQFDDLASNCNQEPKSFSAACGALRSATIIISLALILSGMRKSRHGAKRLLSGTKEAEPSRAALLRKANMLILIIIPTAQRAT